MRFPVFVKKLWPLTVVLLVLATPARADFASDFRLDFSQTQTSYTIPIDAPNNGPQFKFKGTNQGRITYRPHLNAASSGRSLLIQPQGDPDVAPGQAIWFKVLVEGSRVGRPFNPGGTYTLPVQVSISDNLHPGGTQISRSVNITVRVLDQNMSGPVHLSGQVRQSGDGGLSGADVYLGTCCGQTRTRSGASGSFSFNVAQASSYWLSAHKNAYRSAYRRLSGAGAGSLHQLDLRPERWTVQTTPLTRLYGQIGFWRSAASADESKLLLCNGMENWPNPSLKRSSKLYLYNLARGTQLWSHNMGWESWSCDLTDDGAWAVFATDLAGSGGPQSFVRLLDGQTGRTIWTKPCTDAEFPGSTGPQVYSRGVKFSHSGNAILVGVEQEYVYLLNRADGSVRWRRRVSQNVREIIFSRDDRFVYVPAGSGWLHKLRVSDGGEVWRKWIGSWAYLNGFNLSPDGRWLAVGTKSGDLTVLNATSGAIRFRKEYQGLGVCCRFSPDSQSLIVSGSHCGLYLLDLNGNVRWMYYACAHDVRFGPGGRWLAANIRRGAFFDAQGTLLSSLSSQDSSSLVGWMNSTGTRYVLAMKDVAGRQEVLSIHSLAVSGPR